MKSAPVTALCEHMHKPNPSVKAKDNHGVWNCGSVQGNGNFAIEGVFLYSSSACKLKVTYFSEIACTDNSAPCLPPS